MDGSEFFEKKNETAQRSQHYHNYGGCCKIINLDDFATPSLYILQKSSPVLCICGSSLDFLRTLISTPLFFVLCRFFYLEKMASCSSVLYFCVEFIEIVAHTQ